MSNNILGTQNAKARFETLKIQNL